MQEDCLISADKHNFLAILVRQLPRCIYKPNLKQLHQSHVQVSEMSEYDCNYLSDDKVLTEKQIRRLTDIPNIGFTKEGLRRFIFGPLQN